MQLKNGLVVLGLATSHNEEMKQVRGVDQTPYPSQLHGASLATAMQRPCRPLHEKMKFMNQDKTTQIPRRSFTSVQMVHTLDKNGSLYDPAGTES